MTDVSRGACSDRYEAQAEQVGARQLQSTIRAELKDIGERTNARYEGVGRRAEP